MLLAPRVDLFRHSALGTDPGRIILREIQDALDSQRSMRTNLEGGWLSDIKFLSGDQYQDWERHLGKIMQIQAPSARTVRMVWNVTLRIIEDMKAALLQNPPRFKVVPMNGEWDTTQAARYGHDIVRWREVKGRWNKLRKKLMAWLVSTGNAVLWYEWDPMLGPVLDLTQLGMPGQSIHTGDSTLSVASPFQTLYHPHAHDVEESPYVIRRCAVSRQWALRKLAQDDPKLQKAILTMPSIAQDETFLEGSLLDVNTRGFVSLRNSASQEVRDEDGFIQLVEMRMRPSDEYPHGFVAKALGSYDHVSDLVEVQPNPYTWLEDGEIQGGLGCTHFGALRQPGSLFFHSWVRHIRSPQVEINRRQSQMVEHANKAAAGIFVYPSGFAAFKHLLSNDPARTYEGDPHATWLPQWVQPPELPSYVVQAAQAALGILSYIVAPYGPQAQEAMQKSTSGMHMAQIMEDRRLKSGPMVDEWEDSWEEHVTLELRMFQRHQIVPRQISVPSDQPGGRSAQWRRESYSAADLSADLKVEVERGSALPTSEIATLAFYAEGVAKGLINPMDPVIRRRFFQDMKWGDALATLDDLRQDYENAEQNIHQCQDVFAPQPLVNPRVDDLATHEAVYRAFQKTSLFKSWDPMAQLRLVTLHTITLVHLQRQLASAMAMQAAMAGGEEGGGNPVVAGAAAIGPGTPLGGAGSMFQGIQQLHDPNGAGPHGPPGSGE